MSLPAYIGLIGGGHAAGKRTVSQDIRNSLVKEATTPIDVHVIDLGAYQSTMYGPFIDFEKVFHEIDTLAAESADRNRTPIILVHGNYALYDKKLLARARLRIFIDADADTRLSQWILRDVGSLDTENSDDTKEKRLLDDILDEYLQHCRPEYHAYIEATKKNADILLPRGSNALGISVIATSVLDDLRRHISSGRSDLRSGTVTPINLRQEAYQDSRYYAAA